MNVARAVVVALLVVAVIIVALSIVGFVVSTLTFVIEVAVVVGLAYLAWRYVLKR